MQPKNYITDSFINAGGVLVYVLLVAWFLSNGEAWFDKVDKPTLFIPVFMLLLFIVSATITGYLVLGKPILLYLDKQKKEAWQFLMATVGWLILFLLVVAAVLFV